MQLSRFRVFATEVRAAERELSATSLALFRLWEGQWFDEQDQPLGDPALAGKLEKCIATTGPWREPKSPTLYISIADLSAVVAVSFSAPPKTSTSTKARTRLAKCLKHASDAFDAEHDPLTGLLNVRGFEKTFDRHFADLPAVPSPEFQPSQSLALAMLDLDHFKQINDTYGHLYGNHVLSFFARRLEATCATLASEKPGQFILIPARIGGEEFAVLSAGTFTAEVFGSIAESLRSCLERPLPDEKEWRSIPSAEAGLVLPPLHERRVTVSIGLSTIRHEQGDARTARERLTTEGDAALYRAKSGGRNRVRAFIDIVNRYGRVLEYHRDAHVVVIDIGSQIGVAVGQEFLVFHPDFGGDTPYIHSDGRTKKQLGLYPKVPAARIVAFAVQNEISFCRISPGEHFTFPAGCLLEAVAVGTISHLIRESTGPIVSPALRSAVDFGRLVSEQQEAAITSEGRVNVAVFIIDNIDTIIKDRGSAFVNEVLAFSYECIMTIFEGRGLLGQCGAAEIGVLTTVDTDAEFGSLVDAVIKAIRKKYGGAVVVGAGMSGTGMNNPLPAVNDKSALDDKHLLEYARYAALPSARSPGSVARFGPFVALALLNAQRGSGQTAKALVDYERFKQLGLRFGNLDNIAGLCYAEPPERNWDAGAKAFAAAVEVGPTEPVFRANLGIAKFYANDRVGAAEAFMSALKINPRLDLNVAYAGPMALSYYARHKAGQAMTRTQLLAVFEAAKAKREKQIDRLTEEFEAAFAEIGRMAS